MSTATKTAKKANRGHLKRAAAKGQLFVRCRYSMTDDYAWDAENNYGKETEFRCLFIMAEFEGSLPDGWQSLPYDEREALIEELQKERAEHYDRQRELAGDALAVDSNFLGSETRVYGDTESGVFNIHRNLRYEYEIRK